MIYDALPQQQLSEAVNALKTVQYALMSDGVVEDSFACLQASAIRSLEDAIARMDAQALNGERHAELTESLGRLFEYEVESPCPELLLRIKAHQATLFLS